MRRLPSLTGLRFAAAFVVFGFHLHVAQIFAPGPAARVVDWLFAPGAVGVSFFFILSGFVLTWSVRADDTATRFWRRRIAKIYPNHVATWLVALGVTVATGATISAAIALPNLLLVQAWVPDPAVYFGVNTVSWSLACEVFFYALFPLMWPAVRRLPEAALWPGTAAVLAVVWLIPLATRILPADDRYWAIWVFPLARLPEFIAGMLLARIVHHGRWPRLSPWPVTALVVVTYLASRWLPADLRLVAGTVVPLALLVAAVGAADATGRGTPWSSRAMVWLGEISFAFYLVHQLVIRLLVKLLGTGHPALPATAVALAALAVAIACSAVLYTTVERPGMRYLGPRRRGLHTRTSPGREMPAVSESRV